MPPKRDLRLIDEHFESESVDVSTVSLNDVKTAKTVDHKGVFNTEEPKPIRKNSFGPLIIKDWHSDDDIKDKLSPTIEVKTVKPSVEKIESIKTARETVKTKKSPKQHKHHPRGNQRNWNNLMSHRLGINTACPTRSLNIARSKINVSHTTHSSNKGLFKRKRSFKNSKLNNRVNTIGVNQVNTAKGKVLVNAVKGNGFNAVKASACWE
nr:hypothetical protein [Tanacetum cinerariifolium]